MKKERFSELINKGEIDGAYLLHGDEGFFMDAAIKSAEMLIPEDLSPFNLTVLREPDTEALTAACETLPLFSNKTLVVSYGLAKASDSKPLLEYLPKMSPSTVLFLCFKEKLANTSALLKYFVAADREVLFDTATAGEALRWCVKTASRQGVKLENRDAKLFIETVGTDMSNVRNELQKLIDRVGRGGTISEELIRKDVIGNIETKSFLMLDKFISGNVNDGMRELNKLLNESREAPGQIVGFLESRFRLMLQQKLLMEQGLSPAQAAAKFEGSRFANEMAAKSASKFSRADLEQLLGRFTLIMYNKLSGEQDPAEAAEAAMLGFDWSRLKK